ncbi:SDR family oxidoreductase [Compostibacter hankyongensis]|uniref:SDR family oxidoreductase n=1 Tax=Compostibacter hankyongensis TaxID=1007089 RepID=A0ABP8FUI5_9BACT
MQALEQFSLKEKVIVIPGGTGVLGSAFARAVAAAGARVAVIGRNRDKAAAVVADIRQKGGEAMDLIADVLEEKQVREARDRILDQWGRVDGLVNAAGGNTPGAVVPPDKDLFSVRTEAIREVVDLNIYGTVIPTQCFAEVMARQQKGSIINISSLSAQRPLSRVMGYSLAKTAVEGYTQWMAIELPKRYGDGLRVNALAPGVFLTEQNRGLLLRPDGSYSERAQLFVDNTPFGRLGDPEELTGTVIWLLSDASRFVNGAVILVDGGFNAFSGV